MRFRRYPSLREKREKYRAGGSTDKAGNNSGQWIADIRTLSASHHNFIEIGCEHMQREISRAQILAQLYDLVPWLPV